MDKNELKILLNPISVERTDKLLIDECKNIREVREVCHEIIATALSNV